MGKSPKDPTCEESFTWRGNTVTCSFPLNHDWGLHQFYFFEDDQLQPTRMMWKTERIDRGN